MSSIEKPAVDYQSGVIYYRGQAYRSVKRFWHGTQRSVPPTETLERIRPHFRTVGLTRVANITGLDWIGIPVTLAIRPNSNTLTTSSGKGFSLEAATASGAMEAIELFHAEETTLPTFQLPYDQLPENRIPIEDFPLTKYSVFNVWWPYRWTMGWDILNQEEVPVPWWIVHMGSDPRRVRDFSTFQVTSNGLASGNNFLEAINAGLFEVIERDAVACYRLAWNLYRQVPPIVDLSTVKHPLVLELLDRLKVANVGIVLFDCTIDTGVPVYMAYIYDLRVRHLGIYRGYGAHLDPEIAMIRAISEAAQGRVIYIAGSRDDVFRHSYLRLKRKDDSLLVPAMEGLTATVDASEHSSEATPTFEGDTQVLLQKLRNAGLRQAIVIDLSLADMPIKVVKVVVPGLEGYMFDFYTPGRRALAFLRRRQGEDSHIPGTVASLS